MVFDKGTKVALFPFKIAVIYAVVGALWILLSDKLLLMFVDNPLTITRLQTFKGWFFVAISAALLYGITRRDLAYFQGADAELREGERRYRRLHESMTDCYGQTTMSGEIVDVNHSYLEMLGYNEDEALSLRYQDVTPTRWHEFEEKIIAEQVLPRGYSDVYEKEYIRKNGTVFPVELKTYLLRDDDGKPFGMWAIVRDITERKRAEEKLRKNEEILRLFVEHSPAAIAMFDRQMKYISASRRYSLDYNLGEQDLVGRSHYDVFPEMPERWKEIHRRCLAGSIEKADEDPFPRADGRMDWVRWEIHPWYETQGEVGGIILLSEVITTRKKAEEDLVKYREHLENLVKKRTVEMEEAQEALVSLVEDVNEKNAQLALAMEQAQSADRLKSAFLATMSHELRTPLNSILGFTGIVLLGMSGPLNEEQTKQLTMVQGSANHLLSLINDVLDISKIEAGELQVLKRSFDLRSVIDAALNTVMPLAAKKGIALASAIASDVGLMISDRRRVEQILINLLNNAIKFTVQGTVRITARLVHDSRFKVQDIKTLNTEHGFPIVELKEESQSAIEGNFIEISVADTGIGIKPEDMGKLFIAFSQIETGLTRNYEGTGLGLSICRKLLAMLGGTIRVESEWGKGSTFTFTLPLS